MEGTTVVVGAAQGIGAAVARRLAAEPQTGPIVLADVRQEATEELAKQLGASSARPVLAVETDITDQSSIDHLVEVSGTPTKVALVAGIFRAAPSLTVGRGDFDDILAVNLTGIFFAAQAFAEAMTAGGGGAICAVGSIASRMPRMRQAAYCASKAGMRQALRVLGMEVIGRGVRVNFVAPGPTASEMMVALSGDHATNELWRGSAEAMRPPIPDGRVGTPEDIASAVAFLLSEEASHVALHDLFVDGGESLGL